MAPTSVHIPSVKAALSSSISVAAQNCWVKGTGAYTGEIRFSSAPETAKSHRGFYQMFFIP